MDQKVKKIRAIAMDVDGVLTDGTFWWGSNGEEFKRFSFADTTGIYRAIGAGLKVALISGESSAAGMALVQRLADKLRITDVYKGCNDKAAAVREFAARYEFFSTRSVSSVMILSMFPPWRLWVSRSFQPTHRRAREPRLIW